MHSPKNGMSFKRNLSGCLPALPMKRARAIYSEGKNTINFNSPAQVKKILSKMGHKVDSTGIETLEKLDSRLCQGNGQAPQNVKTLIIFC